MGALAVLPISEYGAHETFRCWSTHPYIAAFVVPSVFRAFLWWFRRRFCGIHEAFLRAKSAESQLKMSKGPLEKRLERRLNGPRAHGQLFIMICVHVDLLSSIRKVHGQCVRRRGEQRFVC
jgi:hypothetical protein